MDTVLPQLDSLLQQDPGDLTADEKNGKEKRQDEPVPFFFLFFSCLFFLFLSFNTLNTGGVSCIHACVA